MKNFYGFAAVAAVVGGIGIALASPAGAAAAAGQHGQGRGGALFAKADLNADGKITQAELGQALDTRVAKRKANLATRFARLDTNKDGALSTAEIAARPRRAAQDDRPRWRGGEGRGPGGGGMLGRMFDMADADKNGEVTQAEFRASADRIFVALDTDRNGSVSAAERAAAQDMMRERMRERRGPAGGPADGTDAGPDGE